MIVKVELNGDTAQMHIPEAMVRELLLLQEDMTLIRKLDVQEDLPLLNLAELFLRASSFGVDVLLCEYGRAQRDKLTKQARWQFSRL